MLFFLDVVFIDQSVLTADQVAVKTQRLRGLILDLAAAHHIDTFLLVRLEGLFLKEVMIRSGLVRIYEDPSVRLRGDHRDGLRDLFSVCLQVLPGLFYVPSHLF